MPPYNNRSFRINAISVNVTGYSVVTGEIIDNSIKINFAKTNEDGIATWNSLQIYGVY